MSASDWEEIKRLAADFQRAQLSSSSQRLSERNCIEIINKLIETKKLEVVFTTDGKEYITPQHLVNEIKDELFVHKGRINLVELAKILSVDLSIISSKAAEIDKSSGSISIINGQLIDSSYVFSLCEEINEKLKIKGIITVAELTSQYDLPSDYLLTVIEKNLGKTIKAVQDKSDNRVFFTEDFRKRNICIVRGALMALIKPTSVSTILNLCSIEERLFYAAINSLTETKELPGTITGTEGANCTYIPSIYMKSQLQWVKNFYSQNGYLEFGTLTRLGISNPVTFIKKHFSDSNIIMLDSCAVGQLIIDQVEAAIEDIVSTASFVNILPILPTIAEEKDAEVILNQVLKKKSFQNLQTFNSTVVFTSQYLKNLLKIFDLEIEEKAKECVKSGEFLKYLITQEKSSHKFSLNEEKNDSKLNKKEERRKKAAEGKGGGGVQGRETKTRSTKKKYMKNCQNDDDSDEDWSKGKKNYDNQKLQVIHLEDIKKVLNNVELLAEEDSEGLIEELAEYLLPTLHLSAQQAAKTFYESTISTSNQDRRKKHNELQDKLNDLILKVRLFEKGYKQFSSKDIQQQLAKYLLKTVCTDIANEIFSYVSQADTKFEGKEMTNELRTKFLNSAPDDIKETLGTLNKSLSSSSVDEFLSVIEEAVGTGLCDIFLKKHDKKKERSQLMEQKQQLIDQLNVADDPALILHLSSLIIFQEVTQTMLHASGKFVSTILTFLQPSLPAEVFSSLQRYHDLVLKVLTTSDPIEKVDSQKFLNEDMSVIKTITFEFKKNVEKSHRISE